MLPSISAVICCRNGAQRLPETLSHLAAQQTGSELQWEVLLIDNGSTDETAAVARRSWPAAHPAPLRIVAEHKIGADHARARGLNEARHELITFVDDDNWLAPDFLLRAARFMAVHPEVGAVVGRNEAVCEGGAPPWLARTGNWYALTLDDDAFGDQTVRPGALPTAGLTLRRSAWRELVASGFEFTGVGLRGALRVGMEDVDLCFAMRLAGWRLWRDPDLRLRHYLPRHRLQWDYLRRLVRSAGESAPLLDRYLIALDYLSGEGRANVRSSSKSRWMAKALGLTGKLLGRPITLIGSRLFLMEGDYRVIRAELHIGELTRVLKMRKEYDTAIDSFLDSPLRLALDRIRRQKETYSTSAMA